MTNADLVHAFERLADLLEIDGADRFRINTYRRAARTIKSQAEDIAKLVDEGKLTAFPGIGKATAQRIEQLVSTGHLDVLDELQAKLPSGLPALLEIPGLGPKKVAAAYEQLGVSSMDDLKRTIKSGQLASLSGFGPASVKKIAEGLAFLESSGGRTPIGLALPLAQQILEHIAKMPGAKHVEIAGSIRRGCETIGDIDILCTTATTEEKTEAEGEAIIGSFTNMDGVKHILAAGATKGSVVIELNDQHEIQVDLRVVPAESFGSALQYFTGSKEHNVRLREIAVKKKLKLNEYGLYQNETRLAGDNEAAIYQALGVSMIPPELREDRGEFDWSADALAKLINVEDIRGDLHMHTIASDGKCTIKEMAEAAKLLGYEYIAICDHSKSSTIANGLSIERMTTHIQDIRKANEIIPGIEILVGCECDMLPDGSLDYPDSILSECDWVVASIHSAMGTGGTNKLSPTDRTISAMENRFVSTIGHPTGRLINRRPAMTLDMTAVVEAASRTGTMLEVNASWQRLDLKDLHVKQAIDAGVMICINTDAHHTDGLAQMKFGVRTAKRGGAIKSNVANCLTLQDLLKAISNKRGR